MLWTIRNFIFDRDYRAVRQLWSQAGPGIQLSPSDEPREIKKKLERDPDLFLVAEANGELVGVVLGGFDGRRGMVYHLAVAQAYRHRGVAYGLMEELEARLRAKGCLKYYLLVTQDNEVARRFYEKIGCEVMNLNVMGKMLT
jgi:ribosomal protein S18 acetylase RimI-like enzyme